MSEDLLQQALEKFKQVFTKEQQDAICRAIALETLRKSYYEIPCASCGESIHQVRIPDHGWSSDQTWFSLTCPACSQVTLIGFLGRTPHVVVFSHQRYVAMLKSLSGQQEFVCPEHGNVVKVVSARAKKDTYATAIVKHSPCRFKKDVGFFTTKLVEAEHDESEVDLLKCGVEIREL